MPKFSVIIPVYKVENYIRQCIESVLHQSFTDFEALVVDDCGGDNSISIVEEYARNDSRIRILYHDGNKGLAAARNTALDAAEGDYIVCLDSDDWMEENCLSIIYSEFQKHKTESIWFNSYSFYDETQKRGDKPMYDQHDGIRILTPDTIAAYADFTWIKAYTRKSIQQYNLHWPVGLTFEDGEFYFKYFTLNPKTYVISDCLINYRYRQGSIVREATSGKVKMNDIYTVVRHLKDFWTELGMYESYKYTMIKLIQNRIRMMRGLNYSDDNKQQAYEFLKELGFPEEFKKQNFENKIDNPLVSVVIPVYNVEKYIEECLLSVINQTYINLEIICVDDCGKDGSMKIVNKYAKKDKRIKIIKHKKNRGLGAARNTGLENASGKYIFFIDSDDWIKKECIALTTQKLIETNLNVVIFKSDLLWENDGKRIEFWHKLYANYPEGPFIINKENISALPYYSWNKGYSTDFLIKNNLRWQEGVIYEDMEFFFKVFLASPFTYMIDRSLYVYRRRDKSIISECYESLKNVEDLYEVTCRIKNLLTERGLFSKYKKALLQLIMNNINNYNESPQTKRKLAPLMKKCLDDLKFPKDFEESI